VAKSIETRLGETLVLFPGSLGDFVCLLPTLEALKTTSVSQNLAVAVRGEPLALALHLPWVSRVLSLDSALFASLFSSLTTSPDTTQLFSSVRQVVSWFGYNSPEVRATLARLVPGDVRSFAFFRGQDQLHVCQYYLRCLGCTEIRCPSLAVRDEYKKWLDTYWQHLGWPPSSRVLVLHPGSGGKRKRWAMNGFVEVARWWRGRTNGQVVILLGPAEDCEVAVWSAEGIVERSLSLWQVGALLSRADLYVGNDSGVSHLAGAVGARGVVLFGPTSPEQWRPLGGALTVVTNQEYRATMPDQAGISLQEVPPEVVITELARRGGIR
jgi:ADP-heptose:LPS heptosyltransferase